MIHKRQEFYVIGFNEVGSTSVVLEQMFQTNRTVVCLRRPPTQKQSTSTSGDGAIYIYTSAPLPTAHCPFHRCLLPRQTTANSSVSCQLFFPSQFISPSNHFVIFFFNQNLLKSLHFISIFNFFL